MCHHDTEFARGDLLSSDCDKKNILCEDSVRLVTVQTMAESNSLKLSSYWRLLKRYQFK